MQRHKIKGGEGTLKTKKGKPRAMKVDFSKKNTGGKSAPKNEKRDKAISIIEEKKLVVKKPQVLLDDDLRKFVRKVKNVLIENGLANVSPTALYPFLEESINECRIDPDKKYDAIILALGYIFARRIPISQNGHQPLLCLKKTVGGGLAFKVGMSPRWEEEFQSLKKKSKK